MGDFVGYTLGNLIGAQLMETARRDLPGVEAGFADGRFEPLLGWLREHVHRHGRKLTPDELVERATGSPIAAGPWIAYTREKFSGLYGL
jgi:carboxypeptidase Taq